MFKLRSLCLFSAILAGNVLASGSFSINVPIVQTYSPPPVVNQMCWNGYFNNWQPCTYSPPPVVYHYVPAPVYPVYSHYGYHNAHNYNRYHNHSGNIGFSFSYRSR